MNKTSKLLRIYTDESAYLGDQRLFEFIAALAREQQMAGMTILEAMLGFGRAAHVHRRHALENDRAVVIEIIDEEARLRDFAARIADLSDIGLITLEAIELLGGKSAHLNRDDGVSQERGDKNGRP
ncbi:DUF190 domain-containing protein (plasmid) [Sphingopyxis indica]|uniref:DUF190 domain-containing protein n=1 Tax=Sphingopyxis indica TaxID=436663 RepID=UPI00293919B2|nr:DUF190 domain-containing protein [Sphingopyxis indica]WOF45847.1 DUF190 domain-containing protein [Sphingopyxis indica]